MAHWMQVRRVGLVPFEEDIDPRELVGSFPYITIADISRAEAVQIELVGDAVKWRYGQDTRKANWFDFIPLEDRKAAEIAKRLVRTVPCGAYYKIRVWRNPTIAVEAETLALPLRTRRAENADLAIALTRNISTAESAEPAQPHPSKVERVFAELVDIGAGIPEAFPRDVP